MLLVASCSGGGDSDASSEREAGGTVRLGLAGPIVVDPTAASLGSPADLMVLDLLHDGLTRLADDGVAQPALASDWEANEDLTAFEFQLDPAATFASGRSITPQDVVASLERVMQAGDTSRVALALEEVTGFRAFVDGQAEHVSGLSAPDERSVRLALDAPLAGLPEVLSSPVLGVVDTTTLGAGDVGALDLSGDWAVASADGDVVRLERREGARGSLDAVEIRSFADGESAYAAFDAGEVDWANVPTARFDQALADHGDDHFAGFHAELFFGMNVASPGLRNPAIRQAIQRAIDRDAIVEGVFAERAVPLATVVPAGVVGHDADRCPACGHDPEAAAALVEAAFPDGEVPPVRIDFDESTAQAAMAELVAGDLQEAGIPTELHPLPREEYEAFLGSADKELFSFGWIGAFGSPDAYLAPMFRSGAEDNLTGYGSPEVDGLLAEARADTDAAQNPGRWAEAETKILEDAVVVPIAQFRTQVVVADRVEGFAHAVDGTVDWSQVHVKG